MLELLVPDPQAMERLGGRLAVPLVPGKLFLHGELGAGKTTLVRGFLRAKGYKGAVRSPTYTLIEPYRLAEMDIYHFDLYRIDSPDELEALGARDYFGPSTACLVEWADRAQGYLGTADLSVHIAQLGGQRKLRLVPHSRLGHDAITGVANQSSRD